jgi:hypothetical protein
MKVKPPQNAARLTARSPYSVSVGYTLGTRVSLLLHWRLRLGALLTHYLQAR